MNKDDLVDSITRNLWRLVRGPFLILTLVSVLLGATVAYSSQGHVDGFNLMLIMTAAVLAHISVNLFNEHHDFRSGLDALTKKTPFSGGSGVLVEQPQLATLALILAWLSLVITIMIGGYLIYITGWTLLPLGLVGVALIYGYTGWLTRYPFLCLLSPGVGFGYIMVLGTYYVLTGEYNYASFMAATFSAGLVSCLLLINQIPDEYADKQVGRLTLPIVYGFIGAIRVYKVLMVFSFSVVVAAVLLAVFPITALLTLFSLPLLILVFYKLTKITKDKLNFEAELLKIMALNTLISVLSPVFLMLGFLLV